MMHGTKSLENDRCTFGGSDRTPCRGVEAVTDFAGVAVVDEMLTYIRDQSILWGICKEEPRRRTRDPLELAEYSRLSATSSSSSSSVSSMGSFSLLAVLVAGRLAAALVEAESPAGLSGVASWWERAELRSAVLKSSFSTGRMRIWSGGHTESL